MTYERTALAKAEATFLRGWPLEVYDWPTDREVAAVESTYHELGLHHPEIKDERRWYIAGQIVARVRRDREDES